MSTKKKYSHSLSFTGCDSIFVRLILRFAKHESARCSDPGTSGVANMIDVLSSPVGNVSLLRPAEQFFDEMLAGWNCKKFEAATHSGIREECLWFNYEPPTELHDARYLGDNFRERQTTKRRLQRLQSKVIAMDAVERTAFMQWMREEFSFQTGEVA